MLKYLLIAFLISMLHAGAEQKVVHLFVALCDNETQGIAPVGKAIGDGNKPDTNLYWGCSDGAQKIFAKSPYWKKLETHYPQKLDPESPIMRQIIYQHKRTGTFLVADAYQGKHMKQCLTDYLNASAGSFQPNITLKTLNKTISTGSKSQLTAYIGHNGLMEHQIVTTKAPNPPKLDTITLCCISDSYFKPYFSKTNTRPILQTKSLMYPGAFILHDTLEGWFKSEPLDQLRTRAAKAYANNQKIKLAGGYTIFSKLENKAK